MKKSFLFLGLLFLSLPSLSVAETLSRKHGLKLSFGVPLGLSGPVSSYPQTWGIGYTYNIKGVVEVSPILRIQKDEPLNGLLQIEYNFIENQGENWFIPSLGVDIAYGRLACLGFAKSLF